MIRQAAAIQAEIVDGLVADAYRMKISRNIAMRDA